MNIDYQSLLPYNRACEHSRTSFTINDKGTYVLVTVTCSDCTDRADNVRIDKG